MYLFRSGDVEAILHDRVSLSTHAPHGPELLPVDYGSVQFRLGSRGVREHLFVDVKTHDSCGDDGHCVYAGVIMTGLDIHDLQDNNQFDYKRHLQNRN